MARNHFDASLNRFRAILFDLCLRFSTVVNKPNKFTNNDFDGYFLPNLEVYKFKCLAILCDKTTTHYIVPTKINGHGTFIYRLQHFGTNMTHKACW